MLESITLSLVFDEVVLLSRCIDATASRARAILFSRAKPRHLALARRIVVQIMVDDMEFWPTRLAEMRQMVSNFPRPQAAHPPRFTETHATRGNSNEMTPLIFDRNCYTVDRFEGPHNF